MSAGEDDGDHTTREEWTRRFEGLAHLYRYTSLSKWAHFKGLVARSTLFLAGFQQLNDPFEGEILMDFNAPPEDIRAFWVRHLTERGLPLDEERIQNFIDHRDDAATVEEMRRHFQEEMDKLGVVCFSEAGDDLPMWAYYADRQRGVCLRFQARLLLGWDAAFP